MLESRNITNTIISLPLKYDFTVNKNLYYHLDMIKSLNIALSDICFMLKREKERY